MSTCDPALASSESCDKVHREAKTKVDKSRRRTKAEQECLTRLNVPSGTLRRLPSTATHDLLNGDFEHAEPCCTAMPKRVRYVMCVDAKIGARQFDGAAK